MDLKQKSELRAMAGNVIPIAHINGKPTIDGTKTVVTDIVAANGVIHGIDKVLMPELPRDGKPRSAKATAAALIGQSIQNAVPLFNSGQVDAVAALFGQTADSILQLGRDGVPEEAVKSIEEAISAASKAEDGHDKSWELRKGLDKAFEVLTR
jgi:RNA-binding protein YhbY